MTRMYNPMGALSHLCRDILPSATSNPSGSENSSVMKKMYKVF